jgi:hypothetical protein
MFKQLKCLIHLFADMSIELYGAIYGIVESSVAGVSAAITARGGKWTIILI